MLEWSQILIKKKAEMEHLKSIYDRLSQVRWPWDLSAQNLSSALGGLYKKTQ